MYRKMRMSYMRTGFEFSQGEHTWVTSTQISKQNLPGALYSPSGHGSSPKSHPALTSDSLD